MNNIDLFLNPPPKDLTSKETFSQNLKSALLSETSNFSKDINCKAPEKDIDIDKLNDNLADILLAHKIHARHRTNIIRSCIITDDEVHSMASMIYTLWLSQFSEEEITNHDIKKIFSELRKNQQAPFINWVHHIPSTFKNIEYELYRPEEDKFINEALAENLARAIHAKFRKHIHEQNDTDTYSGMYLDHGNAATFAQEYETLSAEMKSANIDNAFHIPTKLLSIGYIIEKETTGTIPRLLTLKDNEIEAMSEIEHVRWCWERRLNGWVYAETRNNELKHHHCLLPYDQLPPHEKEKDRIMVRFIPALLMDIGYRALKASPELREKISYVNQRAGFVYEVETQISNLQNLITNQNDEIQGRFDESFRKIDSLDDLKSEINKFHKYLSKQYLKSSLQRLETTQKLLNEIKGCYSSGSVVQREFMPQSFELKEHFPESFILLRPKDVVSGDFYFVSKVEDTVLFTAADCTGHGISGSILSGICFNYLHEAMNVNKMTDPLDVLAKVMPQIRELMRHQHNLTMAGGEMELALCAIDLNTNMLRVASQGRPVYAFVNGELVKLGKGNTDIETTVHDGIHFQEMHLEKGDTVYSFSDGYPDQIGGPKGEEGKKFGSKRFREMLVNLQGLNMAEQCEFLNNELESWIQREGYIPPAEKADFNREQTDDISVVAVRL